MTDTTPDAMAAEFDTTAAWTESAVNELGGEYAVVAGCRGSGSPSSLAWLAEALEVSRRSRMLDLGAGVGGPAAWLHERFGVRPVCVEPMPAAALASRRLFGLQTVISRAEALPFATGAFDVAWALGVLCTTANKAETLSELRRVLTPEGRLGLLVFVADRPLTEPTPEGNEFPTESDLLQMLEAAGFTVVQVVAAQRLGDTPLTWQSRADRVDAVIAEKHSHSHTWKTAAAQSRRLGALIEAGEVHTLLVHAVAT